MKSFHFKTITIKNFMGYTDEVVDFDNEYTQLRGFNGAGKTTVLSAICWVLFKKDYYHASNFDLKPIVNGETKNDLLTTVSLEIQIGNDSIIIERENKNGTSKTKVNGAVYKVKEYENFLQDALGINEEDFKLLSNPTYALSLNWKDLRNIIFSYAGDVKDEDIFNEEPLLEGIRAKIETMGVEKFRESLVTSKSEIERKAIPQLNGKIELVESNIKELQEKTKDVVELQKKSKKLQEDIDNYQKLIDAAEKKRAAKQSVANQISELKENRLIINQSMTDIKINGIELKNKIDSMCNVESIKQSEIGACKLKLQSVHNVLNMVNEQYKKNKELYTTKTNDLKSLEEVVVRIENDSCSVCGAALSEEKIKEALAKSEEQKQKEINQINDEIEELKSVLTKEHNELLENKNKFNSLKEELELIKEKDFSQSLGNNDPEYIKLKEKRNELRESYSLKEIELKQLESKISAMETVYANTHDPEFVEDITHLLNEKQLIDATILQASKIDEEMETLKSFMDEKTKMEKNLVNIEKATTLLKKYNEIRARMTKDSLSKYFHDIEFVTQETNKSGKIEETFKLYYQGKPYKTISGGQKIKVQLDLVNGIQTLKKTKTPIMIDGVSELDEIPEYIDTQLITCLTVQKPSKDHPNYENYIKAFSKINVKKGK